MGTPTTFDALFHPFIALTVTERDGQYRVTGAKADFLDSFVNVWRNNEEGYNVEEIIPDGGDPDEHPAGLTATAYADAILLKRDAVALLREIADLIEEGGR